MLGGGPAIGIVQITLFIPAVDRDGSPIDQAFWRDEALRILGRLFRGATSFPPGRGVWRDDERHGELLFEEIVMVTTFAAPVDLSEPALIELRDFIHRLGRDTNQGEVGIVIGGSFYAIVNFD